MIKSEQDIRADERDRIARAVFEIAQHITDYGGSDSLRVALTVVSIQIQRNFDGSLDLELIDMAKEEPVP